MSTKPLIQVNHTPVSTANCFQQNYPGAQSSSGRRGWWNTNLPAVAGAVNAAIQFNQWIIAVGPFNLSRFLAFNISTGQISTVWNLAFNSAPMGLGTDGTYLYVGGSFTQVTIAGVAYNTINGAPINGLCRFSANGQLDQTWNPQPNASPSINVFCYNQTQQTMMVGGSNLTTMRGNSTAYFASIYVSGINSGTIDYELQFVGLNGPLNVIRYDYINKLIYLGGNFTQCGGQTRNNAARIIEADPSLTSWNPNLNGVCNDILIDYLTNTVYLAGAFTTINGVSKNYVGVVDNVLGTSVSSWYINPNGTVTSIAKWHRTLFLGGSFTTLAGTSRSTGIGACDMYTANALDAWTPGGGLGSPSGIFAVDKTIYSFGTTSTYLACQPYPRFTNTNTVYYKPTTGSDSNAGTLASPVATLAKAISLLSSSFIYVVCLDSSVQNNGATIINNGYIRGLFAADGQAPTFQIIRGCIAGTYGARSTGRTQVNSTINYYVNSITGNDSTGARNNPALPFATPQRALADGSLTTGDTIQIMDSGTYVFSGTVTVSKAVTIQALLGQIPTFLCTTNSSTPVFSSAYAVNLYGITFLSTNSSQYGLTQSAGATNIYDCTFIGFTAAYYSTATSVNATFYNTYFYNNNYAVNGTPNFVFNNCYLNLSGNLSSVGAISLNSGSPNLSCTNCTFDNSLFCHILFSTAGTLTLSQCLFLNTNNYSPAYAVVASSSTVGNISITGCWFSNLDTALQLNPSSSAATVYINNSMFSNIVEGGIYLAGISGGKSILNCGFFYCGSSSTNGGICFGATYGNISNCCFIGCTNGVYGITSGYIYGCCEYGSTHYSINGTCTVGFSVTNTASTGSLTNGGSWLQTTNPKFISTTKGSENCGLAPGSPALMLYRWSDSSSLNHFDAGISYYGLSLPMTNFDIDIDGFIFNGDQNFETGLYLQGVGGIPGSFGWVEHCSFYGLGSYGAVFGSLGYSTLQADNCMFNVNNSGIELISPGANLLNNVFQNCGGAGIINAGIFGNIIHNTIYGCQYGQYDYWQMSNVTQRNCVYAGNSQFDYYGNGTWSNSLLVNTGGSPTIGSTCVNGDPLFQNSATPNLMLQATNLMYPFDSPAKNLGNDGGDAGAYLTWYGAVLTTWTNVTFTYNPNVVPRVVKTQKGASGNTFGGVSYSFAAAFAIMYTLKWNENTNMPASDVSNLLAIYQSPSHLSQISLDGGSTWINTTTQRDNEMSYREIGDLYVESTVPTPIDEISFITTN